MRALALMGAVWYGLTVAGFSLDVHWCHGEVAYVEIGVNAEGGPQCGCEVPKPCCEDDHITVELHTPHVPSAAHLELPLPFEMGASAAIPWVAMRHPVQAAEGAPLSSPAAGPPVRAFGWLPAEAAFIFAFLA